MRALLKSVNGVKDVFLQGEADGVVSVLISSEEETDVREDVFYVLAENRCPVLEMNMSKLSLEDIFLEMTKSEEPEPAEPEEQKPAEETAEPDETKEEV